jgi:hypothetical protein
MKWLSIIPVVALTFLAIACEKHPASQLPEEGTTAFGEHSTAGGEAKPEAKAGESATTPGTPAPSGDAKEAPKFFPGNTQNK